DSIHFDHATGQRLDFDIGRRGDFPRLDHEIAQRPRLAQQHLPRRALAGGQRLLFINAVVDIPGNDPALARAARTAAAAVRQYHALTQGAREHAFTFLDGEFAAAAFDADMVSFAGHSKRA